MSKALVVVDVQSFFLKRAPADLPAKIEEYIKTSKYSYVAFTVFKNSPDSNFVKSIHWEGCQAPEDITLPEELQQFVSTTDANVFSNKNTYSSLKALGLYESLQAHGISELDICGIDTDACVLATAFEAFDFGYEVNVLFDLCFSQAGLGELVQKIATRNLITKN